MNTIQNPLSRYPEFLRGLLANTNEIETLLETVPAHHVIEQILYLDAAWFLRLEGVRKEYLRALATKLDWPPEKITYIQSEAKKRRAKSK